MAASTATVVGLSIRPCKAIGFASIESVSGLEGSTQSFLEGAPLKYSSGYIVVANAASTDTDTPIIGFAAEDAHNITQGTQLIRYYPALSNYVFEGTWASDAGTATQQEEANVGTSDLFTLGYDSTNKRFFVDAQWQTKGNVMVIGPGLGTDTLVSNANVAPRVQFVVVRAGVAEPWL
jgi:hypothetical protein